MVDLTPNGRVTGIGSLPLDDPEAAARWLHPAGFEGAKNLSTN